MPLMRTIERLRERPEHERAAVAGWAAVGVVAVLFVAWAGVFLHGLAFPSAAVAQPSQETNTAATVVPVQPPTLEWQQTNAEAAQPSQPSDPGAIPAPSAQ